MKMEEGDTVAHSITTYSDRRLRRKVRACKRAFHEALREVRPGKRRFAHYEYLQCVYCLYSELREKGVGKKASARIGSLFDRPIERNTHLVRTIINATSAGIDAKTASRWSQALRYCWRQRDHWSDLQSFIRTHSGIAGCASAFANRKRPGKAQEKRQGDRAPKQQVRKANLEKHVTAIDRTPRPASDLASPGPPPPPATPASPPARIVTALASRGFWPR